MRHTVRRALALMMALLMAASTLAFAENSAVPEAASALESADFEPEISEAEEITFGEDDADGAEATFEGEASAGEALTAGDVAPIADEAPVADEAPAADGTSVEDAPEPTEAPAQGEAPGGEGEAEGRAETEAGEEEKAPESAEAEETGASQPDAIPAEAADPDPDAVFAEPEDETVEEAPEEDYIQFEAADGVAEDVFEECAVEADAETVVGYGGLDNDELLDGYAQMMLDAALGKPVEQGFAEARENLTPMNQAIYELMAERIKAIAAGTLNSTVITISIDELVEKCGGTLKKSWTAEELGVEELVVNGKITEAAVKAAREKVNYSLHNVIEALLADFPYELYWYNKVKGCTGTGFTLRANSTYIRYDGAITISMTPSADYGDPAAYTVNGNKAEVIATAIANAKAIVKNYRTPGSVRERLQAYKDRICELTDYNYDAIYQNYPYGDPWQLIHVFDGDATTKVVCEGYSKAFKYLCDLSHFGGSFDCILATGTMGGGTGAGNHMWNVVRMDDGRNYLVDVTNSESGTIGNNNKLFMAYNPEGSWNQTYTFNLGGGSIKYTYDDNTKETFSKEGELVISSTPYQGTWTGAWAVNINEGIQHGRVSADPAYVMRSDTTQTTVTLTVVPDKGYELRENSLTVTGEDNNASVSVSDNQFVMPPYDVTVSAAFDAIPPEMPTINTQPSGLNLTFGTGGKLEVAAAAADKHKLSWQWYTVSEGNEKTAIAGATDSSYAIPADQPVGTTRYCCVVTATRTDNGLSASVTSNDAAVTVSKAAAPTLEDIPIDVVFTRESVAASLSGVMPGNAGTLNYTAGVASVNGGVSVTDFTVDATTGALSAAISGGSIGDVITLPVTIASRNYENAGVKVVATLAPIPIDSAEVALSQTAFTYDGARKAVAVTSVTLNGTALVQGVDYTVEASSALAGTQTGSYLVTVRGMGSYGGSATATWTIVAPTPTPTPTPTPAPVVAAPAAAAPQVVIPATKTNNRTTVTVTPGTVAPLNLGGATATGFKSSNRKVATVDKNGNVTFKKAGKVRITMKVGRKKRTVTLVVKDATIPGSVSFSPVSTAVKKGNVVTLTPVIPANTHTGYTWKSSNRKVATVRNGVVTFKKAGRVTITATATRGKKKARVTFKVSK